MMEASAVVFTEAGKVEFQKVQCPEPGDDDVVVRVLHSWISPGTEGQYLRGEHLSGEVARRPEDPYPFPIVAGYQKAGIVEWRGRNVDGFRVGDRVFAAMSKVSGMFSPLGGHVSPSVTPLTHLWHVPAGDLAAYSGLVLTQVGYNCGSRPVSTQGGAVVIGDGLVGHWAAQCLSARGARVLLVGRHDSRLAKFHGTGRHTVNSSQEDWIAVVRELFPSGASVMVDTAGDTGLLGQFARLAARNGEFVSAGFYGLNDTISLQSLRVNEISIHAVSGWEKKRMDATVGHIRDGVLETMPLVTHRFPAERAASAWDAINGDRENVLGVLLDW